MFLNLLIKRNFAKSKLLSVGLVMSVCLLLGACSSHKKWPSEKPKLDQIDNDLKNTYKNYREAFMKIFLDENKNRFSGAVAENILVTKEALQKNRLLPAFENIKFSDGTIHAGFALAFLSLDVINLLNENKKKESLRSLKLFSRVLDGVFQCDADSFKGVNGFLLRDLVDKQSNLSVQSDFLNIDPSSNEMSHSQVVALMIGFDVSLLAFKNKSMEGNNVYSDLSKKIKEKMSMMISKLNDENFCIRSEIIGQKKVRRGKHAEIVSWLLINMNNKWNSEKPIKNTRSRWLWSLGRNLVYNFYYATSIGFKKYLRNKDAPVKKMSSRTWRSNYYQCLSILNNQTDRFGKANKKWERWVWHYQNGLAVSLGLMQGLEINPKLIYMLKQQLLECPEDHLPNSYHLGHKGWNLDNRWIRLLTCKVSPRSTSNKYKVYNGLDFLIPYSAYTYGLFQKRLKKNNKEKNKEEQ